MSSEKLLQAPQGLSKEQLKGIVSAASRGSAAAIPDHLSTLAAFQQSLGIEDFNVSSSRNSYLFITDTFLWYQQGLSTTDRTSWNNHIRRFGNNYVPNRFRLNLKWNKTPAFYMFLLLVVCG